MGDRKAHRAKITMSDYDTGGEAITAKELGMIYVEELFISQPDAAGIDWRWDQTAGTSVTVLAYDEDDISGVAAEHADAANTDVFTVLAIGF